MKIYITSVDLKYTYKVKQDDYLKIETLVKLGYKPVGIKNDLILMYNNNINGLQEKLDQCYHRQHPARGVTLDNITRCTECGMPIYDFNQSNTNLIKNTYRPYMQYIENNGYVIKFKIGDINYGTGIDINSSQEEKDKLVKGVLNLLNNLSSLKLIGDGEYSTDDFINQQTN